MFSGSKVLLCLFLMGCNAGKPHYVSHEVTVSLKKLEIVDCVDPSEYRLEVDPGFVVIRLPEGELPPTFVRIKPTTLSVEAGFVEAELEAVPGGEFVDSHRVRIWSMLEVE